MASNPPTNDTLPRPARELLKRALLGALVVVLSSATAVATAAMLELGNAVEWFNQGAKAGGTHINIGGLDEVDPGGPQTILLLGADKRWHGVDAGQGIRSDTMMVVRLDPDRGATAVMSIPRDLKVDIPGHERSRDAAEHKINAAMTLGGPQLAVKTVRKLLDIPIHHVVVVNFRGFRRAVNRLGCIYTDVDRRYFNDNRPPVGSATSYATIDVKAGYQKLCGQDALDYVRYRHADNDIIRAARQQQFLADAKDQVGVGKVIKDREELLKIFGAYTQTDIHSEDAILRLLKLTIDSAGQPMQELHFPGKIGKSYVTISEAKLRRLSDRFMNGEGNGRPRANLKRKRSAPKKKRRVSKRSRGAPGMTSTGRTAEDLAIKFAPRLRFPILYPKKIVAGSTLLAGDSRAYTIVDRGGRKHRAYRFAVHANADEFGQNYGVQGTTWDRPPILEHPTTTYKSGGRTYQIVKDGGRVRIVGWRSRGATYWVSNTLLMSLSSRQMMAIARSLGRVT